jgi:CheY-like chemotaxis protein
VDLEGLKVLVTDDNPMAREILTETMRSFGFEVGEAADGEDALAQLHAARQDGRPFDLVLMDWKMPGMDGIETSRRIRATAELAELPIVMVTAFGREHQSEEGEAAGINAFLTKPVQQSVLFDTLMQVLSQGSSEIGAPRTMVTKKSVRPVGLEGAHLLLAEDNVINQEVAVGILSAEGITVDVANNGVEAVDMVGRKSYDAVLMDMQMPEMDGYDAARRIREDDSLADLPIIAMTAHAMEGDREKCLNAGMNDYVTKPIDPKQLFEVLGNWVEVESPPDSSEHAATEPAAQPALPELPGFDTAAALARLGGNEPLYRKLLTDLARGHRDDCDKIREAIAAGDLEAARRIAHTLKGVAGNLSAQALQQAAAEAESMLRAIADGTPDTDLDQGLAELGRVVAASIDAIHRAIPEATVDTQPEPAGDDLTIGLDQDRIVEVARRLKEFAEMGDVDGVMEAIESLPDGSAQRTRLAVLADDFDFDALVESATELQRVAEGPG